MSFLQFLELYHEQWRNRSLLSALVARQIKARYRGSVLGLLWTLLNPLLLMLTYTIVFSFYLRVQGVVHYPIFVFTGLLPWLWFSSSISEGTSSLVASGHLITKSQFPPQLMVVACVTTGLINMLLSLPVLFVFMVIAGHLPDLEFVPWLILLIILTWLFLCSAALSLSLINVRLRDTQHLVGSVLTLVFFLTPIVYPVSQVPKLFARFLILSPVACFITAYQDLLYFNRHPSLAVWGACLFWVIVASYISQLMYARMREQLAEYL